MAGFASGFTAAPSEKSLRYSIGTVAATVGAAVAEEEAGLLRATPFAVSWACYCKRGCLVGLVNQGQAQAIDF
jgi:hypothetical protein